MKALLIKKTILLITCVSLIMISCSKKEDTQQPAVPSVNQPSPISIGAIVDSGIVNTGTRAMVMDLNTENFILYGANEEVAYVPAKVRVAFYVNNDGLIPSGDYNYSNSYSKSPYTFDSGVLMLAVGSDSFTTQSDQIVDGVITVRQDGNKYVFSLQITLASGMTASQSFSGSIVYADRK
jgi:hypothetical protein